jgi:hypothetical protein
MAKFEQLMKQILGESPVVPPAGNQPQQTNTTKPPLDLTKLTADQLAELVAAANNPKGSLDAKHPLYQQPTNNQNPNQPQNTNTAPVNPNQQNATNKPTI